MKKLFKKIIKKIRENEKIDLYFLNYFFVKEPSDPPNPCIVFCINDIKNLRETIHFTQNGLFEIDFTLKIYAQDEEFDELSNITELIIKSLDSCVLIENFEQISLKNYKTEINHEYSKKRNENYGFFQIQISFKAWCFFEFLVNP